MVVGSAQMKAGTKADCWAQTKAMEINLEKKLTPLLVGMRWKVMSSDQTKADCLCHTPTHFQSLYQRIVYCRSRYTYRCSNDKDRMFLQLQYHYIPLRLELQPRRYVCTPMAVKKVGSSAQMKAQMKVDCWAQTKAIEINLEKKLAPLLVGMRWKVTN